jgi:hypothetical protein
MAAKTIADKLLIKPGGTVWISDDQHLPRVGPLPEEVELVGDPREAAVAVLVEQAAGGGGVGGEEHRDALTGTTWIAYPKGNKADINRDTLWPIVTEYGLRPNGQVAVDEVWSALRFRPYKEGEAPFTGGR